MLRSGSRWLSWLPVGCSWGLHWPHFGCSWLLFGVSWGPVGFLLRALGARLLSFWVPSAAPWGTLDIMVARLGCYLWVSRGSFGFPRNRFGVSCVFPCTCKLIYSIRVRTKLSSSTSSSSGFFETKPFRNETTLVPRARGGGGEGGGGRHTM